MTGELTVNQAVQHFTFVASHFIYSQTYRPISRYGVSIATFLRCNAHTQHFVLLCRSIIASLLRSGRDWISLAENEMIIITEQEKLTSDFNTNKT